MILQESKHDFDVAILGNGLSGSLLATVLGKQGVSVVLIDADQHPRFAVGESTTLTPPSSFRFSLRNMISRSWTIWLTPRASPAASAPLAASSATSAVSIIVRARFTTPRKDCNSGRVRGMRTTGSARISTHTCTTWPCTMAPCLARKPKSRALRLIYRG